MEEKAIITCTQCGVRMRIPVKNAVIKFACQNSSCGKLHYALLGHLILGAEPDIISETAVDSKTKSSPLKGLFWKIATVILAIILVVVLFRSNPDQRTIQDRVTQKMLAALKDTSQESLNKLKSMLTDDSRIFFETFIESQFINTDTASRKLMKDVISSVQPMEYFDSRKFMYVSAKNDTNYFRLDYIPKNDEYFLKINYQDFAK